MGSKSKTMVYAHLMGNPNIAYGWKSDGSSEVNMCGVCECEDLQECQSLCFLLWDLDNILNLTKIFFVYLVRNKLFF